MGTASAIQEQVGRTTSAPLRNARHEQFCCEYLKDFNATRAYRRVYPRSGVEAARRSASDLLTRPDVVRRLDAVRKELAASTDVTAAWVVDRLRTFGVADIRKVFDEDGRLRPIHTLPDEVAQAIASIEVVTSRIPGTDPVEVEYTHKVKLVDKLGAFELLGKHTGAFQPQPLPPSQDRLPMMVFVQHNEYHEAIEVRATRSDAPPTLDAHATEALPVMNVPMYGTKRKKRA